MFTIMSAKPQFCQVLLDLFDFTVLKSYIRYHQFMFTGTIITYVNIIMLLVIFLNRHNSYTYKILQFNYEFDIV